jgi:hypothetical protein
VGVLTRLEADLDVLLGEDPAGFDGAVALDRAARLVAVGERLQVAVGAALLDVGAREAFVHAGAGSVRDWLRMLPAGDAGRLGRAQRWDRRRVVRDAVASGAVGVVGADAVCSALGKIDDLDGAAGADGLGGGLPEDQLHGVLVHAVPTVLGSWLGQGLAPADRLEVHRERRVRLAEVLTGAANGPGAGVLPAADRLEPVLALLAEALPSSRLVDALGAIVDALQPEQLDAEAARLQDDCFLRLTRRRGGLPGWDVTGLFDDELAHAVLALTEPYLQAARRAAKESGDGPAADSAPAPAPVPTSIRTAGGMTGRASGDADVDLTAGADGLVTAPVRDRDVAADGGDQAALEGGMEKVSGSGDREGELAAFGVVGPGVPVAPLPPGRLCRPAGEPVEGEPLRVLDRDPAKSLLEAFRQLLDDLARVPTGALGESGADLGLLAAGRSVQLTILTSLASLAAEPGAPPPVLDSPALTRRVGPVRLAPAVARRLACGNLLATVGLDAHGRPVDDSGEHRHATRAQRRALKAQWGSTCAVNGCTQPGVIPHHVLWFSKGGLTITSNLVPLCRHHHHDVHEGHRTLRTRDDRLITPDGWAHLPTETETESAA